MRSDAGESAGRGKRGRAVLARWVSVERAARMLDVSRRTIVRMEAAGVFGAGNAAVLRLPGSRTGDLRIRVAAVNRVMEGFAERREMDRLEQADRRRVFLDSDGGVDSGGSDAAVFSGISERVIRSGEDGEVSRG